MCPCSFSRGSAVFPDVHSAVLGLNKQQQMGWPPLCAPQSCETTPGHVFVELLLTVGWVE